jgi:hypothetical protein
VLNISGETFNSLRRTLLQCGPFETNQKLRSLFAHPQLQPWQVGLPQTESVADRVDALIDYLATARRSSGEYVLPALLRVLKDRTDPQTHCYDLISNLVDKLSLPSPQQGYSDPRAVQCSAPVE